MIAIALACGPKLLFADEPTTALDVTVQAQILDLLQEQERERFMAMILVTHDLGVVANRTDDIMVMYAGAGDREGADTHAVRGDAPPLHPRAAAEHPEARPAEPLADSKRSAAGRPTSCTRQRAAASHRVARMRRTAAREEVPPLAERETPGHEFACFYPVGTPEGDEARARNEAAGTIPSVAAAASAAPTATPSAAAPKSGA